MYQNNLHDVLHIIIIGLPVSMRSMSSSSKSSGTLYADCQSHAIKCKFGAIGMGN